MANGRFSLGEDVSVAVLHVETRLGGVGNSPDNQRGDFDWVAAFVVDLELFGIGRPRAQRNRNFFSERIGPVKTTFANGAAVFTNKHEDARFVGFDREK